ncbi:MAG: hypothetical protein KDA84_09935 [Planctomycetaceae bacterium]|nr:hypothetical protein [Planctomycetaceae bacterium]
MTGKPWGWLPPTTFFAANDTFLAWDHRAGLLCSQWNVQFAEGLADNATLQATAELLGRGEIVALVEGTPEIGPRALGRRSSLADPTIPHIRQSINHLKKREYYRPMAPAVLHDQADALFENYFFSPYMLYDFSVRPAHRETLRECLHEDGTARLQSVTLESNLGRLLNAVQQRGKLPVLINTSLNSQGQPIAADESSTFEEIQNLGIGYALIGGRLFRRTSASQFEGY